MRLTPKEFGVVVAILDKIDAGASTAKIPGRMGRFLRQYRLGRARVDEIIAGNALTRRADAAVAGGAVGAARFSPIVEPTVAILEFPLGEVSRAIVISEELGGLLHLTMWLKAASAQAAFNALRDRSGIAMIGDYRWTPPWRLSPGDSHVVAIPACDWANARCLKAVSDDIDRPAHALEYLLDSRIGPPCLKYFRTVCVRKHAGALEVLPGLSLSRALAVEHVLPPAVSTLRDAPLAELLIFRAPWSVSWTIARAKRIEATDALVHGVEWADFQCELNGTDLNPEVPRALRVCLRGAGVPVPPEASPEPVRRLLPVAREILRWLHGKT